MMKKLTFILIMFLVVMSTGIGIVSAETLTGTFTSDSVLQETKPGTGGTSGSMTIDSIYLKDIGSVGKLQTVLLIGNASTVFIIHDSGFQSGQTPFTSILGSGTIGYNEVYDNNGVFLFEFVYVTYGSYSAAGHSGNVYDNLTYDHALVHNLTLNSLFVGDVVEAYGAYLANYAGIAGNHFTSSYITPGGFAKVNYNNVEYNFANEYTATGSGGNHVITGHINKTVENISYSSRGSVIDGTTGAILVQEDYPPTSDNWTFSVFQGNIKIGVIDSRNVTYYTSTLFPPTDVTPTPTPTLGTGEPAAGYVRTIVHVRDRSGAMIHGSNIHIKDVEGNVWSNSTSDADAIHSIDTHPDHVVNIYADFTIFENEFLPGSLLTQYAGSTYYLTLDPFESAAPAGNVSLYVEVKDTAGSFIPYANVQIFLPSGYSYAGSTANLGSKVFIVPNETQIRATGTAAGYLPGTVIGNSGTSGSTTMLITLSRQFVTTAPTTTIPLGGVTPAITIDPNDPLLHGGDTSFQGQEMMRYLANNGMTLVQLCFMVTILALLGFKFGK